MKDIAIQFEKISLGNNRYLFRPVGLIRGSYNESSKYFIGENSQIYYLISGNNPKKDRFFYAPTTLSELRKVFGSSSSTREVITEYFSICMENIYIGIYDERNKRMDIAQISFNYLEDEVKKQFLRKKHKGTKKVNNLKVINKKPELNSIEFEWSIETPYDVLRIEKRDYTSEELNEIVDNRVKSIMKTITDKSIQGKKIDEILDAYNEIVNGKRYYK